MSTLQSSFTLWDRLPDELQLHILADVLTSPDPVSISLHQRYICYGDLSAIICEQSPYGRDSSRSL
jgi:hypothetical protein